MRVGVVIAGVCAVILSTYFVVALLSPPKPVVEAKRDVPETAIVPTAGDDFPPLAKAPPYPRAVVDEKEHDFGRMEVAEEKSHAFTIRNDGEAPLLLVKGPTTCQCTVSDLETGELAVGKSAKITLKWKPAAQAEQFSKGADIRTNDPENRTIHLRILGMVTPRLVTAPETTWESPDLLEREPTTFTGAVLSPIAESFQIAALECPSPLISADAVPLNRQQLAAKHGRSGYMIRVTVSPDIPIGPFTFPLKIKTDLPARRVDGTLSDELMEMEVLLTGHRRGPIRILGGSGWDEKNMAVILGSFDVGVGKKVSLPMFVRGEGAGEFHLVEPPACEPAALQVTIEQDGQPSSTGKVGRFRLNVGYPPGSPKANHRSDNPGKIRLRTSLPDAPVIDLLVYFAAY
jgi:hypothetical protein